MTSKAKVTHVRNVYQARKLRLLRRIPAQPMREVRRPTQAAIVDRISSALFPVRITSACSQMSNHVSKQTMRVATEQVVSCIILRKWK